MELDRRQLLMGGAALTIGAATTARAWGRTATPVLSDIDHIVILIQENRSFDHYFGTYRGVRGFSDPSALPGVFAQPDPPGGRLPFHLDTATTSGAECTHDITHSWGPQHASWDHGAMDGFVRAHRAADGDTIGPLTMGYYTRHDLPFHYALADAFTICDGYHCSVMGPTDPNRLYSVSATIDPRGGHGGPLTDTLPSPTPKPYIGRFTWTTMPERLQSAGISWKVYQSPAGNGSADATLGNTGNNVLAYFRRFVDTSSPLFRNAFLPTYPGDFRRDLEAGNLPQVSWVLFEQLLEADEHPPAPPLFGEQSMWRLLSLLLEKPEVWAKTALLITYDENGGFFDHLPPPTAPPGTAGEYLTDATMGPIGLGFRVPLLVVSPYSRGGLVCSDTFDHTSLLRLIETRFGVEVPNLSPWRRSVTGDLTAAFNFGAPPALDKPALPLPLIQYPTLLHGCSVSDFGLPIGSPPAYPIPPNAMPTQEPGRPRRPKTSKTSLNV